MKKTEGKKLSQAPKAVQVVAHTRGNHSVKAHKRLTKEQRKEKNLQAFDLYETAYNSLPGLPKPVDTTPTLPNPLAEINEPKANYEAEMDKTTSSTEKLDYLLGDIEVEVKRFNQINKIKISGRVYADIKNNDWDKYLTPQSIKENPQYVLVMFNFAETAKQFGKIIRACHSLENIPVNRYLVDFGYEVGGELSHRLINKNIEYQDLIETNLWTTTLLKKRGNVLDQDHITAIHNLLESKGLFKDLETNPTEENKIRAITWIAKAFKHLNKWDKK